MLSFQWNALRIGDPVLVHGADTPEMVLRPGVVTMVDASRRGPHGIGVRVAMPAGDAVMWPSRASVHLDPRDVLEPCWRCAAVAIAAS
jgi:hypothetical protein